MEQEFWKSCAAAMASDLSPVSPWIDTLHEARDAAASIPTGDHWA